MRSSSGSSCLPIPSVTAIAMFTMVKLGFTRTRWRRRMTEHVEQHLADLHLAEALAPVAPDELDDRGAVALEGLGVAARPPRR